MRGRETCKIYPIYVVYFPMYESNGLCASCTFSLLALSSLILFFTLAEAIVVRRRFKELLRGGEVKRLGYIFEVSLVFRVFRSICLCASRTFSRCPPSPYDIQVSNVTML